MSRLSRRQFLSAAGGTTLALTPIGRALFAAARDSQVRPAPPLFTALPYVQPGDASKLVEGRERKVIAWATETKEADFHVDFGPTTRYGRRIVPERRDYLSGKEGRYLYAAHLDGLFLSSKVFYRVVCNGSAVCEGFFTTRQKRGQNIRFVAVGDTSNSATVDNEIAYQAYQQHPDFVMNTGDNVYDAGLMSEYEKHFFPSYNATKADPLVGAPLLASVPFYTVLGNHDVRAFLRADFDIAPDSLGYYTALHLPLNGIVPTYPTAMIGAPERLAAFRKAAGSRFPVMANYSYDVGDVHFCCIDANTYQDPTDPAITRWIEKDLTGTDATWKFMVFHHPGFNVGNAHYREQQMRALSPLFEKCGVDMALHGHEHTYQRPRPFKFAPRDLSGAHARNNPDRRIPGEFTIDRDFDGKTRTKPNGVLYIVTGGGGASLHDAEFNTDHTKWQRPDDNNVDYIERFFSAHHSLTAFDVDGERLTMTQMDKHGQEVDRIIVTKA